MDRVFSSEADQSAYEAMLITGVAKDDHDAIASVMDSRILEALRDLPVGFWAIAYMGYREALP